MNNEIGVTRKITCKSCNGLGGDVTTCGVCGGTGYVRKASGFFAVNNPCPQCKGQGEFYIKSAHHVMAKVKQQILKNKI